MVFEGSKRYQELNLANTGKDTARYFISLVENRMSEDGAVKKITQPDSGQRFASKFIRLFPRNVIIPPHESQVVKIQLTKTNQLISGEYRSHLHFRAEPDKKPLGDKDSTMDTTSVSISLVPIFGITIPVIIRVGESNTKVHLSNLLFEMVNDTTPTLKIVFNRSGNMSAYGNIYVDYISQEGDVTRVGDVQGVAVYTPNLIRHSSIVLKKPAGISYHTGKLHVMYTAQPEDNEAIIAEAELRLR